MRSLSPITPWTSPSTGEVNWAPARWRTPGARRPATVAGMTARTHADLAGARCTPGSRGRWLTPCPGAGPAAASDASTSWICARRRPEQLPELRDRQISVVEPGAGCRHRGGIARERRRVPGRQRDVQRNLGRARKRTQHLRVRRVPWRLADPNQRRRRECHRQCNGRGRTDRQDDSDKHRDQRRRAEPHSVWREHLSTKGTRAPTRLTSTLDKGRVDAVTVVVLTRSNQRDRTRGRDRVRQARRRAGDRRSRPRARDRGGRGGRRRRHGRQRDSPACGRSDADVRCPVAGCRPPRTLRSDRRARQQCRRAVRVAQGHQRGPRADLCAEPPRAVPADRAAARPARRRARRHDGVRRSHIGAAEPRRSAVRAVLLGDARLRNLEALQHPVHA